MIYFCYFSFSLIHLELKITPDFRPQWSKSIPAFRPNQLKTIPFGAAHTYIADIGEYAPTPRVQTIRGYPMPKQLHFFNKVCL